MEDILCNNIRVISFINNPVPSNAYLLIDLRVNECIVIDPGSKEQNDIKNYIISLGYTLRYIIITHEHFDHYWGVNDLLSVFPAKVVTTQLCKEWVLLPMNYFNKLYYNSSEMYSIEHVDLTAEMLKWRLLWNDNSITLFSAKGHTNKGMCISIGNFLFTGDTIILNTKPVLKNRYGASIEDYKDTIEKIYKTISYDTIVFPGHGNLFRLVEMKTFFEKYFADNGMIVNL